MPEAEEVEPMELDDFSDDESDQLSSLVKSIENMSILEDSVEGTAQSIVIIEVLWLHKEQSNNRF